MKINRRSPSIKVKKHREKVKRLVKNIKKHIAASFKDGVPSVTIKPATIARVKKAIKYWLDKNPGQSDPSLDYDICLTPDHEKNTLQIDVFRKPKILTVFHEFIGDTNAHESKDSAQES